MICEKADDIEENHARTRPLGVVRFTYRSSKADRSKKRSVGPGTPHREDMRLARESRLRARCRQGRRSAMRQRLPDSPRGPNAASHREARRGQKTTQTSACGLPPDLSGTIPSVFCRRHSVLNSNRPRRAMSDMDRRTVDHQHPLSNRKPALSLSPSSRRGEVRYLTHCGRLAAAARRQQSTLM